LGGEKKKKTREGEKRKADEGSKDDPNGESAFAQDRKITKKKEKQKPRKSEERHKMKWSVKSSKTKRHPPAPKGRPPEKGTLLKRGKKAGREGKS